MPENITDISDKTWTDLKEADRDVLQELGSERDGIDGRWKDDALAAAILAHDGRDAEVPEEPREEYRQEMEAAQKASSETDENEVAGAVASEEGGENESDDEAGESDVPTEDDREIEEDDDEEESRHKQLGSDDDKLARDCAFIIDAAILDVWLDYPDRLVDECRIHVMEDGLQITAVDPANVGMVDTDLADRAFESFDVQDTGQIGVNLERLTDVLGRPNAGDLVNLTIDTQRRNLVIEWGGGHEYTLSLIDPDSIRVEPDLPDLDLPAQLEFPEARTLFNAIDYTNNVTDHIQLEVDGPEFRVFGEGDTDTYELTLDEGSDEITLRTFDEARSLFSLDYLVDMSRAWEKDEPLSVELGVEMPVILTQEIHHDDNTFGEAIYLLAPRIQSD